MVCARAPAGQRAYGAGVDQLVDSRDIGMPKVDDLPDVFFEARETEGIAGRWCRQDAQRDEAPVPGVVCCPDVSQSALTDCGLELIRAKPDVRAKPHMIQPAGSRASRVLEAQTQPAAGLEAAGLDLERAGAA